jgi:hypothetical protein
MNNGEFKYGIVVEKEEFLVCAADEVGHTIDYSTEEGLSHQVIIVWDDEKLRDRIVELLNKYGMED